MFFQALVFLPLDVDFPSDLNIRAAMVSLCGLDYKHIDSNVLPMIDTWSSTRVLGAFKTDNTLVISVFLYSRPLGKLLVQPYYIVS
jgi:hypothetical protein